MTETKPSLLQRIDSKIEKLSQLVFHKKYFPLTLVLIILLFGSYMYLFYQWFFPHTSATSSLTNGARVLFSQSQEQAGQSKVTVAVDLSEVQGVTIDGVQVIAELSGTIPDNVQFTPNTLPGLEPIIATVDQKEGISTLKVAYLSPPTQQYTIQGKKIELGTLSFTQPSSGTLTFDFSPSLNKMLEHGTLKNMMVQPVSVSYTF